MKKKKISIVSYGVGNIGSLVNIISKSGADPIIAEKPSQLKGSKNIILPGVGAFDNAMKKLKDKGFYEALYDHAMTKQYPILGICIGMHLLTRGSEEGEINGMGIINAETIKFKENNLPEKHPIPHMGWNRVRFKENTIFYDKNLTGQRFYFVHSYYVVCDDDKDVMSNTEYGHTFASSFKRDNVIGVQFHPEKSHRFGIKFFNNYIEHVAI